MGKGQTQTLTFEATRPPEPEPARDDNVKRRQILDGARQVFLTSGFDAASMNEVARAAGVSKGTLYVYFTNKEDLFEALIREEKRVQAERICQFDYEHDDLRTALTSFGLRLLDLMLRPASVAHFRTVIAVGARFPRLGTAFYESGPRAGIERLSQYLRIAAGQGFVQIGDFEFASEQFLELLKGHYLLRAILGVPERRDAAALARHVDRSVDAFLRLYGTPAVQRR